MKVAGPAARPSVEPPDRLAPHRAPGAEPVARAQQGAGALLRADRGRVPPRVDGVAPVPSSVEIERARISVGVMRHEMADLLVTLSRAPEPTREDRVALWALRGELRKLVALDEYVSGFLRG